MPEVEILIGLGIVLVIWWFIRSRQSAPVVESALRNLRELDALGAAAWLELEDAIETSDDPAAAARAMLAHRRSDLSKEIDDIWTRLDDLSARINQRAEHYEVVARRPAPPLEGQAAGVRAMQRIRTLARS